MPQSPYSRALNDAALDTLDETPGLPTAGQLLVDMAFNSESTSGLKQIASEQGLQPHDQVSVNGSTDLSACLVGNDNARVFGINMKTQDGGRMYDDVINADARGPEGFGSGSLYLAFTDESGDTYCLSIYSSSRSTHTLKYNSNKPAIKRIFWSN